MNDLEVCLWPIDRPRDYEKNARKWSGGIVNANCFRVC